MEWNKNLSILSQQTKNKISIVNIYIDNFLMVSNTIVMLEVLKNLLAKKYKMKDLQEFKTIIG